MRVWASVNRDRVSENNRQWRLANPYRAAALSAAKRARKRGAKIGDRHAYARTIQYMRTAARVRCYYCGRVTLPRGRHIDHIIPLARGGADAVGNICVACPRCNLSKRAKMPEEVTGQAELVLA